MTTSDVDGFEIDIEVLDDAQSYRNGMLRRSMALDKIVELVIKNLTQDSKKRFEEYQEQNDPCKENK